MNKSILIVGLVAMLLFAPACENLFSNDDEEELNQNLIGVWYRYSLIKDGVQYGFPALVKLLKNGSGTIESLDEPDQEEPSFDSFVWATDGATITITDENDSTVWSGSFTLSDNNTVVRFTYSSEGHSYDEIYVKYTGGKDAALIGTWIMVNTKIGIEEPLTVQRIVFSQDGTATDYRIDDLEEIQGDVTEQNLEIDIFTWNTSGNYLIVFDEGDQIPMVIQYSINDAVFIGTAYNDEGLTEEFTFVKDTGEIDPVGVGTWLLSSVTIDGVQNPIPGLQIILDLSDDMSGTWTVTTTFTGTQSYTFNWKTNSGYVFVYRSEMPQIAWVKKYQISGNTMTLKTETEYYEGYGWVTAEYTFTRSQ
ncbi:MAG: hypothetical protein Q7J65_06420 [Candidatus Marinimicrobia bacterium]|nr:hypothetical protein [Candidatus Neomarinimicrobiota bacterium]